MAPCVLGPGCPPPPSVTALTPCKCLSGYARAKSPASAAASVPGASEWCVGRSWPLSLSLASASGPLPLLCQPVYHKRPCHKHPDQRIAAWSAASDILAAARVIFHRTPVAALRACWTSGCAAVVVFLVCFPFREAMGRGTWRGACVFSYRARVVVPSLVVPPLCSLAASLVWMQRSNGRYGQAARACCLPNPSLIRCAPRSCPCAVAHVPSSCHLHLLYDCFVLGVVRLAVARRTRLTGRGSTATPCTFLLEGSPAVVTSCVTFVLGSHRRGAGATTPPAPLRACLPCHLRNGLVLLVSPGCPAPLVCLRASSSSRCMCIPLLAHTPRPDPTLPSPPLQCRLSDRGSYNLQLRLRTPAAGPIRT